MNATGSITCVERVFLDWSSPLIEQAARWLLEHRAGSGGGFDSNCIDLRAELCVVPGSRAGRLLLEDLLRQCETNDRTLLPPRIATPGNAVDELLAPARVDETDDINTVADGWTVELAWMEALRQSDDDTLRPLAAALPEPDNTPAWQRLARTIAGLHETLAGARCAFADVAPRAEAMEMFPEGDRWAALAELFERYVTLLQSRGLIDPQVRREQLLRRYERIPSGASDVSPVLIGVVELNDLQRAALMAAAAKAGAFALVHAPDSLADRFDALGCVREAAWDDVTIDDERVRVVVADRPMDQAQRVIETIASFDGAFTADDVVIGLGDANLSGVMRRSASWAGLALHDAAGLPMARSPVFRVLKLAADWLQRERFADFAALVRHPHVERWLQRSASGGAATRGIERWARLLDIYYSNHLQGHFTGQWLGSEAERAGMARIHDAVQALLAPLRGGARPLGRWTAPLIDTLETLYQEVIRDADWAKAMRTRDAVDIVARAASDVERSEPAFQPAVDAATAIRMILIRCEDGAIAEPIDERAVEMLGWLELHADPAAALIIAGFNDGAIPSSVTADMFLPDALRRRLGLPHNQSRYARDAYLIAAAQQCRRSLTIIAGRRASNDEPLTPSRLLLNGDDELLVRRAKLLCDGPEHLPPTIPIGLAEPPEATAFTIPSPPRDLPAVASMRVTDFKAYLDCPYRFALARLLKLEHLLDDSRELDGLQFGGLLHDVLRDFGNDAHLRESTDPQRIAAATIAMLNEYAQQAFGERPLSAVQIQLAMLQQRLIGFANLQAEMRREGWRIQHVEYDVSNKVALDIPGEAPMSLRGRIDRIDHHLERRAWRVIDYKSGEKAFSPHEAHHGCKSLPEADVIEWCDLQLPLYEYILQRSELPIDGPIELCYVLLPRSSDAVNICPAKWQQAHLDAAIEKAREIVRAVRAERFEPTFDPKRLHDAFARLCHTEYMRATAVHDEEADE